MALTWGTPLLRLSVFSTEAVSISDKDWETLTGQDESETRQNVVGGRRLAGKLDGGQLALTGRANRADVILAAMTTVQDEAAEPKLPTLGDWGATREKFVARTTPWLDTFAFPVVRIAFAVTILSHQQTREEAYSQLGSLLSSVKVDPARMKELLYRVNWPTESGVAEGLPLNRVLTFIALRFGFQALEMSAAKIVGTSSGPEIYGIQLEMDINTDAENTQPFDVKNVVPIYRELVSLAAEVAATGEPT